MTDGEWLSHGPESIITSILAMQISKKGKFLVFPEASPKKVQKTIGTKKRGRPSKVQGKRFDLVVWAKTGNMLRAIVEIKHAWNFPQLQRDQKKIAHYMKGQKNRIAGYLLAYTEARGSYPRKKLEKRFEDWEVKLKCKLVDYSIHRVKGEEWHWAVGLYRLV